MDIPVPDLRSGARRSNVPDGYRGSEVVALTIEDRERIIWGLDDVRTEALAEPRGVLLQEREWRAREGLV